MPPRLLAGVMIVDEVPICPLCVVVHAVNLLLVGVLPAASGQNPHKLLASLGSGLRYLGGADAQEPALARWKGTGLVTGGPVGVTVFQWVLIQVDRHRPHPDLPPTLADAQAELQAEPVHEIPVKDTDARWGPPDAAAQLVVFSDFKCPACGKLAHELEHVRLEHPEVSVVFKHFPLRSECNPGARSNLHPDSCTAAYAAEAARRQGRFWEFHDALFATTGGLDDEVLRALAEEVGVDVERFEADRTSEPVHAKIQDDASLGDRLDIPGTPSVYLNGREVSARGMSFLLELLKHVQAEQLAAPEASSQSAMR